MTIVLDPELEARLRAVAAQRGTDPQTLAVQAIEDATSLDPMHRVLWNGMTVSEWIRESREWAEGNRNWPNVPDESLSRESFYADQS